MATATVARPKKKLIEPQVETPEQYFESLMDPVVFAQRALQQDPWSVQAEILRSIVTNSRTAVKACHSSGKTAVASWATLFWLWRYRDGIVITTAPTGRQVRQLLWGEIHSGLARSKVNFPPANLTELRIGPKRYAMGFTAKADGKDEGVNFQGFHGGNVLMILDEAPGVRAKVWESIEGVRAGGNVKILALGNPTITGGPFYDAFHTQRATWATFTISAFNTPNLQDVSLTYDQGDKKVTIGTGPDLLSLSDEELDKNVRPYLTQRRWVRDKFIELGPNHPLWQSRMMGEFPSQSDDAMFPLSWLEAAKNRDPVISDSGPLYAGLDVASPGKDETVLYLRNADGGIVDMWAWPESDPRGFVVMKLIPYRDRLMELNVDALGLGHYMAKHLEDLKLPVRYVKVTDAASDTQQFANAKAEMYWAFRKRVEAGELSGLTDEQTFVQLLSIRFEVNSRGQIQIESKDDAARRGVKSPDRAEALILSFRSGKKKLVIPPLVSMTAPSYWANG